MRLSLRMTPTLICTCCGQDYNNQNAHDDAIVCSLYGTTQYAQCPTCKQTVSRDLWTREYKWKWTHRWRKLAKEIESEGPGSS